MSKYSEGTIKQAEELIEKHAKSSIHIGWHRNWLDDSILKKDTISAIKAAIVSCEFAIEEVNRYADHDDIGLEYLNDLKRYLEELL
jgi:hypothetical protein